MHTLHLHPFLDKKRRTVDLIHAGCNLALPARHVAGIVGEGDGRRHAIRVTKRGAPVEVHQDLRGPGGASRNKGQGRGGRKT